MASDQRTVAWRVRVAIIPWGIVLCVLWAPLGAGPPPAYGMDARFTGGTGEPNDPYQIATAADVNALGEKPNDYDKHFILCADIDLDPNLYKRRVFDKAVIAPDTDPAMTGCQGTPFTGVFDGNGHTISHLTIKGGSYLGLFGCLGPGAEVKNLGLVDVDLMGSGWYIGGLVGWNNSAVIRCYATGVVGGDENQEYAGAGGLVGLNDAGGGITQCHSTAGVSGGGVGGLVGENWGRVTHSHSTGAVSGYGEVGGLVGCNRGGTVDQCKSDGDVSGGSVVGGLVGWNDSGSVTRCCSSGVVSGDEKVGGLVGYNGGDVADCYSIGVVSGNNTIGGLVGYGYPSTVEFSFWDIQTSGQATSSGGLGLTTAEMHDIQTYRDAGWDFRGEATDGLHEIWQMPQEGGYPVLAVLNGYTPPQLKGTGTPEDPYLISHATELGAIIHYNPHAHYRLMAAIDLSGIHWGTAVIPSFVGTFDGNSLAISHLTINGGSYLGLFGQLGRWDAPAGEVKDLGVVEVTITGSDNFVGGLVGRNYASVLRCYGTGVVKGNDGVGGLVGYQYGTMTQCHCAGTVSGHGYVGSLAGANSGSLTQCTSSGTVSGSSNPIGGLAGFNGGTVSGCHSASEVHGNSYAGGLVAWNSGTVVNCTSTAVVSGKDCVGGLTGYNGPDGTITQCASGGAVSGRDSVGGLVGSNGYGAVSQCRSTGGVSGTSNVGGLVGTHYNGRLAKCYSHGSVTGKNGVGGLIGESDGPMSQCYSAGAVKGSTKVGGLVGATVSGSSAPATCFWDTETSGQATDPCGIGKTTAEMQVANTFVKAGWDFVGETANGIEDIWWISEGKDYPRLWWERSP